jgi:hypothetical protein
MLKFAYGNQQLFGIRWLGIASLSTNLQNYRAAMTP